MHEQFANGFYRSAAWKKCRKAFWEAHQGLCTRCMARGLIVPGAEVHHRIRITPENLDDPGVTLNWDNLELLCKECHLQEHARGSGPRTDANGHVDL